MKKCCETCWHRDSEPHEEPCISCRYDNDVPSLWKEAEWYEPDTNADRIRAMSDEELAELFGAILREREIILLKQLEKQGIEASVIEFPDETFNAHLEWLKQLAE